MNCNKAYMILTVCWCLGEWVLPGRPVRQRHRVLHQRNGRRSVQPCPAHQQSGLLLQTEQVQRLSSSHRCVLVDRSWWECLCAAGSLWPSPTVIWPSLWTGHTSKRSSGERRHARRSTNTRTLSKVWSFIRKSWKWMKLLSWLNIYLVLLWSQIIHQQKRAWICEPIGADTTIIQSALHLKGHIFCPVFILSSQSGNRSYIYLWNLLCTTTVKSFE